MEVGVDEPGDGVTLAVVDRPRPVGHLVPVLGQFPVLDTNDTPLDGPSSG